MKEFFKKYGLAILIILPIIFILTYFWFIFEGCFPVGENLEKSHWLGFWAGFLSFVGTVFLGVVALWQNDKANELNNIITSINDRSLRIEEEKLYPFLTATTYKDDLTKRQVDDEINLEEITASKSFSRGGIISLSFMKRLIDANSDYTRHEITVPIKLINNSPSYITRIILSEIEGSFLPLTTDKTHKFTSKLESFQDDFSFEPINSGGDILFKFVLQTNIQEIIEHFAINYINFKLQIETLNYKCEQEIILQVNDCFKYKYHKLKEKTNDE